jgi:putative lipoprotein (rSAM/lipoprotein system)
MAKVKRGVLRGWNVVIAWVLGLFGVACSPFAAEYGTPQGKFIVNGTVQSEDTHLPVNHIRVIMERDTAYSDDSGKYRVETLEFPTTQTFNVNFTDIDGTSNGTYQSKDTLVVFDNPNFKHGDGHWYNGETDKKVDVKLK